MIYILHEQCDTVLSVVGTNSNIKYSLNILDGRMKKTQGYGNETKNLEHNNTRD